MTLTTTLNPNQSGDKANPRLVNNIVFLLVGRIVRDRSHYFTYTEHSTSPPSFVLIHTHYYICTACTALLYFTIYCVSYAFERCIFFLRASAPCSGVASTKSLFRYACGSACWNPRALEIDTSFTTSMSCAFNWCEYHEY